MERTIGDHEAPTPGTQLQARSLLTGQVGGPVYTVEATYSGRLHFGELGTYVELSVPGRADRLTLEWGGYGAQFAEVQP